MGKPTAKDKRHFKAVAELGCINDGSPAEIHHSRAGLGMGQRDHSKVIPLCPECHRMGEFSRHINPLEFEARYGTDAELVDKTNETLGE